MAPARLPNPRSCSMAADPALPTANTYVNTPGVSPGAAGGLTPPYDPPRLRRYRLRTGMVAWLLHRLTGLGLVLYIVLHIWGLKALSNREAYNELIAGYHAPIFKIGEFGLWIAVVYHMLNGLRIVLIDFLGWSPKQKRLFWTLGAVAVLMILAGGYPSLSAVYHWLVG